MKVLFNSSSRDFLTAKSSSTINIFFIIFPEIKTFLNLKVCQEGNNGETEKGKTGGMEKRKSESLNTYFIDANNSSYSPLRSRSSTIRKVFFSSISPFFRFSISPVLPLFIPQSLSRFDSSRNSAWIHSANTCQKIDHGNRNEIGDRIDCWIKDRNKPENWKLNCEYTTENKGKSR